MRSLADKVVSRLKTSTETEDLQEYIMISSEIFRKLRLKNYKSGIKEIDCATVTLEEGEKIEKTLIDLMSRNEGLTGTIIYALGNRFNRSHKELYKELLNKHIETLLFHNNVIHQIIIALDNIDEEIIEKYKTELGHQSVLDIEKNLKQAKNYLMNENEIDISY